MLTLFTLKGGVDYEENIFKFNKCFNALCDEFSRGGEKIL